MANRASQPRDDLDPRTRRGGEVLPGDDSLEPLEPDTLVIENEILKQGFTLIPNYVLRDPTISPGAKTTFMLLLSYAWQEGSCFPGQARLARELGVAKRSIIRWLQELEEHQIIASRRRGLGKTNVYYVLDKEKSSSSSVGTSRSDNLSLQQVTDSTTQEVPKRAHNKDTAKKKTQQQKVVVDDLDKTDKKGKSPSKRGGDTPDSEAVTTLVELGISATVARRLADRFEHERIFQKIDFLKFLEQTNPKKVSNPRGWLRSAIENDYGPPDGYQTPEEREAEASRREQQEQQAAARLRLQEESQREREQQERERQQEQWRALQEEYGTTEQELTAWPRVLDQIKRQTTPTTFQMLFPGTKLLTLKDGKAVIGVPNLMIEEWLRNRLKGVIQQALKVETGEQSQVSFVVVDNAQNALHS